MKLEGHQGTGGCTAAAPPAGSNDRQRDPPGTRFDYLTGLARCSLGGVGWGGGIGSPLRFSLISYPAVSIYENGWGGRD